VVGVGLCESKSNGVEDFASHADLEGNGNTER
jgi:hypothetical protein